MTAISRADFTFHMQEESSVQSKKKKLYLVGSMNLLCQFLIFEITQPSGQFLPVSNFMTIYSSVIQTTHKSTHISSVSCAVPFELTMHCLSCKVS